MVPVEFPTTRQVGASALARSADVNAAFADPEIRGILTVVGGEDQITVIPHLDAELVRRDPKPLWGPVTTRICTAGCGSTGSPASTAARRRCTWGRAPDVDHVHARSLRAALLTGENSGDHGSG